MRRLTSRNFRRFAPAAAAVALAIASCAKRDPAGITLALSTDVVVPEDIDAVALVFTDASNGRVIGAPIVRAAAPSAAGNVVRFPSTITLQTRFEDDSAGFSTASSRRVVEAVQIAIVGLKGGTETGTAVTLRRIVTSMPTDGVHLLRVAIPYLDVGGATGDSSQLGLSSRPFSAGNLTPASLHLASFGIGGIRSTCGDDDDRVDGICAPIGKVDGQALPSFEARNVFGGGESGTDSSAKCFKIPECFQSGSPLAINRDTAGKCTAIAPVGDFTLALVRKPGAAGPTTPSCVALGGQATCLAPLDNGTGYSLEGGSIVLSKGICDALADKRISGVVFAKGEACVKTPEIPLCGPSSSVQNANNPYQEAGALLVDAAASDGATGDGGADGGAPLPSALPPAMRIGKSEVSISDFVRTAVGYVALSDDPQAPGNARLVLLNTTAGVENSTVVFNAWPSSAAALPSYGRIFPAAGAVGKLSDLWVSVGLSKASVTAGGLVSLQGATNSYSIYQQPVTDAQYPYLAHGYIFTQNMGLQYYRTTKTPKLCVSDFTMFDPPINCVTMSIEATAIYVSGDGLFLGLKNGKIVASTLGAQDVLSQVLNNELVPMGISQGGLFSADGGTARSGYAARYTAQRAALEVYTFSPEIPATGYTEQTLSLLIGGISPPKWEDAKGEPAPGFAVFNYGGIDYIFVASGDGLRVYDQSGKRYANLTDSPSVGKIVADGNCVTYAIRTASAGIETGLFQTCFGP
jgi:hypothetical protein